MATKLIAYCKRCGQIYRYSPGKTCPVCCIPTEDTMRFEENNTTRDLNDQPISKRSCMQVQEGGSHYHQGTIQPIEYIHANELNFFEGNAIKYVTRNRRKKSAVEDLKKAIHYIQLQLKLMHGIDSRIEYDAISRD